MFFLLSGEGPTDMGACHGTMFLAGPMAVMVDRLVERKWGYSILDCGAIEYVSEHHLNVSSSRVRPAKKSLRLPGKSQEKETRFFYTNARTLAVLAKDIELERSPVIAVLFRDADGTVSAGRGNWKSKRKSMEDGFLEEGFLRGVPMIPKPKSEAWLICALKADPYHHCESLEDRSGNDKSPNPLKAELEALMGGPISREKLSEMVADGTIDPARIDMPSFQAFQESLMAVLA